MQERRCKSAGVPAAPIGDDCDTGTYAMLEGSSMVYIISTDAADALRYTTYASLKSELICDMVWDSVESMSFTIDGQTYTVEFSEREEDTINDDGQAETNTVDVYSWDGQELNQEEFENLKDSIDALQSSGTATGEASQEMISITFNRDTEYFSQMVMTVSSYSADQCLVSFNGEDRLTDREFIVSMIDIIEGLFA